jgi:phage recombination protein Bet
MNQLVAPQQREQYFNPDQIEIIKGTICKGATNLELKWFLYQCARARLDPFSRQIYWIKRRDGTAFTLVSIDGLRLVAQRSGEYAGQVGPEWCDANGTWGNIWLNDGAPFAARVGALRKGEKTPTWGVARFDSYAPRGKDGRLYGNWLQMPDVMIAKCAEALALRKAFPQDLSGLYSGDEMQQAIPDSERELLDKDNMGGPEAPATEEEEHKAEVQSDSLADQIIETMRGFKDHNALYVYRSTKMQALWKDIFPPDRDRIGLVYKELMTKFGGKT